MEKLKKHCLPLDYDFEGIDQYLELASRELKNKKKKNLFYSKTNYNLPIKTKKVSSFKKKGNIRTFFSRRDKPNENGTILNTIFPGHELLLGERKSFRREEMPTKSYEEMRDIINEKIKNEVSEMEEDFKYIFQEIRVCSFFFNFFFLKKLKS